jgi:maltose/moltooligosaccharide transporter
LGASEGQLLGSVPAGVVKNAICDVLVVQTSALDEDRLDEDRLFAKQPTEATSDNLRPATEADPGGRSPTP